MLKTLLRVQLISLKNQLAGGSRNKRPSTGRLLGVIAVLIYAFGAIGFLFFNTFGTLGVAFHAAGLDWLYFCMAAIMCFGMMFIGSVFTAKAQLYEAKDNDLLLSLPVPPRDILLSRLLLLWLLTLFFGLLVTVPVALAWQFSAGFTAGTFAAFLVLFLLLLPLLSLTISALFGWLIHLATARVGKKSLVTVLLSLVFLGLYMYVISQLNLLVQKLADNAGAAAQKLGSVAPLYAMGLSVAGPRWELLLLVAAAIVALFVLAVWLLSRTFIKTATDRRSGAKKKKYVERSVDALSPQRALLQREWRRFLAIPSYILNSSLGAIFLLIAAVYLLIQHKQLAGLTEIEGVGALMPWLFILGMGFCGGMTMVTAPSISLEGKSLWIVRSLPVESRDVLKAKLRLHCLIAVPPTVLASLAAALVFKPDAPTAVCLLAIPVLLCLFTGLLGLAENLRHPNLDWINETQAVKSGASVMLTMFITWGAVLPPVLAAIFLSNFVPMYVIGLIFAALLAVVCLLLYRGLMRGGVARFENL